MSTSISLVPRPSRVPREGLGTRLYQYKHGMSYLRVLVVVVYVLGVGDTSYMSYFHDTEYFTFDKVGRGNSGHFNVATGKKHPLDSCF